CRSQVKEKNCKSICYYYYLIYYFIYLFLKNTLKFNKFCIKGRNAMKQSPCTPPRCGLSDSTKHAIGGHAHGPGALTVTNQQN
ncbi:MAG: hypothetical protein ACYT04_81200, partial [Nostoc sp.]